MNELYDVIIIGGGPAGLTAAIYLTRARYRVLLLEKEQFGGQITISHEVVNYPGVGKCSGKELTDTMYNQAEYFGTEFLMAEAVRLSLDNDVKIVHTTKGDYRCLGILIATGAHPKMVGFEGEEEFKGRGVAYCATCDGEFFTGKEVYVIGGGYAAAEESIFLTKFASHVTILIRKDDFSCAKALSEQAKNHDKITVITNTVVEQVNGENNINYIRYKNQKTGDVTECRAREGEYFGVFVFVGYEPETELVKDTVELNEQGYVITDKSQKTSREGVYAAGDICIKPLRQVITAASDGALAATELERYVSAVQRRTGLAAKVPEKTPDIKKDEESHFTSEMRSQLDTVFERMEKPLILKLYLDDRDISGELEEYIKGLVSLTDKLSMEISDDEKEEKMPCVKVLYEDKTYTGIAFHGVPGGHEFTSFVLGLYNAAGPGQPLDEQTLEQIKNIKKKIDIMILVTLSCSMCPDLVVAAEHIASLSENVSAEIYDVHHFDKLREKYNVMSVPCMIINDEHVSFGKKNMQQLLEIIENM